MITIFRIGNHWINPEHISRIEIAKEEDGAVQGSEVHFSNGGTIDLNADETDVMIHKLQSKQALS